MQDLGKKLVWGVSVDSVYVLFGESTCGFVWTVLAINTAVPTWQGLSVWVSAVLLSGCGQSGQMVKLLESRVFHVLWGRNRREPTGRTCLFSLTILSMQCLGRRGREIFRDQGGAWSHGMVEPGKEQCLLCTLCIRWGWKNFPTVIFLLGKSRYKCLAWSLRKGQA